MANYDFSEFAPGAAAPKAKYDFSEFSPEDQGNNLDPNVLNRLWPAAKNVGNDIWGALKASPKAAVDLAKAAPGYVDYLKQNIPAAGSLIKNDPASAGKEAVAGLADMGHSALNIPSALANYLAKIGMIKPETAANVPAQRDIKEDLSQFVGGEKPGGDLIRGTFRNSENLIPAGSAVNLLNPLKFTAKGIAKDVVGTEAKQVTKHSKAYDKIWAEADSSGFNKVPANTKLLSDNLSTIEKYKTPREYQSLENFILDPTLQNAQKAQSDMGIMHRKLEEKSRSGSLTSEEQALYKAAHESEKHIEKSMFKNSKGETNDSLQNKYGKLTKSYRENVVPYKYNSDIQAYKNKEMLAKELISRLKRGEFAAKKGSAHPRIAIRDMVGTYGLPASFGAGYLLKKLLGETTNKPE